MIESYSKNLIKCLLSWEKGVEKLVVKKQKVNEINSAPTGKYSHDRFLVQVIVIE